jgi:hypothetical protein
MWLRPAHGEAGVLGDLIEPHTQGRAIIVIGIDDHDHARSWREPRRMAP